MGLYPHTVNEKKPFLLQKHFVGHFVAALGKRMNKLAVFSASLKPFIQLVWTCLEQGVVEREGRDLKGTVGTEEGEG